MVLVMRGTLCGLRRGAPSTERRILSRMRQEPDVRGFAITHPGGSAVLPQSAGWDQLIYATSGVMSVPTGAGTWVIPPDRAVWVPAGVPHRLELAGRVAIRTLYLRAGLIALPGGCRAVNVHRLLRELIRTAVPRGPLFVADPPQSRLIGVILDLLVELPTAPLRVPLPADPRARAAASAIRADPSGPVPGGLASRRTLERLFRTETGMAIGQYPEPARLLPAPPRPAS